MSEENLFILIWNAWKSQFNILSVCGCVFHQWPMANAQIRQTKNKYMLCIPCALCSSCILCETKEFFFFQAFHFRAFSINLYTKVIISTQSCYALSLIKNEALLTSVFTMVFFPFDFATKVLWTATILQFSLSFYRSKNFY